jgi:mono/diheme cytochrome c family protein
MKAHPLAVVAFAASFVVGCKSGSQTPASADQHPGQLLFNGHTKPDVDCYKCHDGEGRGATGPDLAERVPKLSDEGIVKTIMEGKGLMPSFKDKVTPEEASQIAAWLHAKFPAGTPAPPK